MTDLKTAQEGASSEGVGRHGALDRSLLGGLVWTGATKWATQLVSWLSTLLVARLLTPADYGIVGMAAVYLGFAQLINEFGLGTAIIQQKDLGEDQLARLGGFAVLVGVTVFAVSAALAAPVASFFGEPVVSLVVTVLAAQFVLSGVHVLPYALLTREMQFRKVAWTDATEALAMTAVTLGCALAGLRYWALVVGSLTARLAGTIVVLALRGHRIAWPRRLGELAGTITMGWHVVVSRVAWYAYSNADFAVVGRVLGKSELGGYAFGWNIASIPVDKVSATVSRVTFPVFSAAQDDHEAVRRYLLRLTEGLSLLTFPAAVGLALMADIFVPLALGPQWMGAVGPLRVLALYGGIRSVIPLFFQVLMACGHARRNAQFSVLAAIVLPGMFWLGAHWGGPTGVAAAWLLGYPLLVVPFAIRYTIRTIRMSPSAYLKALWPATSGCLAMTLAVLLARWASQDLALAPRFGVSVASGALTYCLVLVTAHQDRVRGLAQRLQELHAGGDRTPSAVEP